MDKLFEVEGVGVEQGVSGKQKEKRVQYPVDSCKGGCVKGLDWSKAAHIWCQEAVLPIPKDATRFEGVHGGFRATALMVSRLR